MPLISEDFKMRPKHNWYSKIIRKFYKIRVNLTKPRNPVPDSEILKRVEREKRLVIQIPFGGLGDHLAYSSLPELLWQQKRIKTFISLRSVFRSEAIRDFVWGLNPFVEFTHEKGWFTYRPLESDFNILDGYFQKLFGLTGNACPRVYYQPRIIEQIKEENIVDPSFGPAGKANGYYEADFHDRLIDYIRNNIPQFVVIVHKHSHVTDELQDKIGRILAPEQYRVDTIMQLADVLFSAKKRYLMYSGSASLSAAMRLPSTVLCNRKAVPTFQYEVNNYVDLMQQ